MCITTNIDERRAASLLLAKHGVPLLHKTKIKQHTYTINRMKITSMWNQTRIVVVSPGVNDDNDGAAQKQQPTGERRRRVVHCSQNSKPAARGAVEAAAQFVEHPAHIGKEQWKGLCAGLLFFFWIGGLGAGTWTPWLQEQRRFAEELRSEGKGEARCKGAARPWRCGRGEQRLGRPAASSRAGNKCGLPEAGSRLVFHGR